MKGIKRSDKTKDIFRNLMKTSKNKNLGKVLSEDDRRELSKNFAKEIIFFGIYYHSISFAARTLGIKPHNVISKLKSKKYIDCYYLKEKENDKNT